MPASAPIEFMPSAEAASGPAVLIGIGASVPFARKRVADAIDTLRLHPMLTVLSASAIIDTPAFGGATAQRFANAALVAQSPVSPNALLRLLWSVETRFGRIRGAKNGPRTLDLDLLAVQGFCCDSDSLTLPHPGLRSRPFARLPSLEALAHAPEWADLALGPFVR